MGAISWVLIQRTDQNRMFVLSLLEEAAQFAGREAFIGRSICARKGRACPLESVRRVTRARGGFQKDISNIVTELLKKRKIRAQMGRGSTIELCRLGKVWSENYAHFLYPGPWMRRQHVIEW